MLDALLQSCVNCYPSQNNNCRNSRPSHQQPASEQSGSGQTKVSGQQSQHNHDAETTYDAPIPARAHCPACNHYMPVLRSGYIRGHGPCTNRCKGSGVPIFQYQLPRSVPQPDVSCTEPSSRAQSLHSQLPFSHELRCSIHVVQRIPQTARHFATTKLAQCCRM